MGPVVSAGGGQGPGGPMEVPVLAIFCREDNDCMDLDALDGAVCARSGAWRENGVQWRIRRCPAAPKPAANLSVERASAMADLTLWMSGEAELGWSPDAGTEPGWRHYEISSVLELNACLDDLEAHLGLLSRLIRSRWPSGPFMRSGAASASAAGHGRRGGWRRRCWPGRPGAGG